MNDHPIARWHKLLEHRNPKDVEDFFAEDAVFLSPIGHKPQQGKVLTIRYLAVARYPIVPDPARTMQRSRDSNPFASRHKTPTL